MKLEFQNKWVRLLIEFLPTRLAIRRYRVASARLDGPTSRVLRRRIAWQMRRTTPEATR